MRSPSTVSKRASRPAALSQAPVGPALASGQTRTARRTARTSTSDHRTRRLTSPPASGAARAALPSAFQDPPQLGQRLHQRLVTRFEERRNLPRLHPARLPHGGGDDEVGPRELAASPPAQE